MIAGLDSAEPQNRPTAAMIPQLKAAGIRLWIGYIATRGGVNLLSAWDQTSFDIVRQLGSTPVAMCSGLDDPVALKGLAAAWNVSLCLDDEAAIRPDGPWVQPFLDISGAGLYGNAQYHVARSAPFHILAAYPCPPPQLCDPGATWSPNVARPPTPTGWQWAGTHTEFGLSVDRGWYDDWFLTGGDMALSQGLKVGLAHTAISAVYNREPTQQELFDFANTLNDDGSNYNDLVQGLANQPALVQDVAGKVSDLENRVAKLEAIPPGSGYVKHHHGVTTSGNTDAGTPG
jgi:hypothetical protein